MLLPVERTHEFAQLLRSRTKQGEDDEIFYDIESTHIDTFTEDTISLRARIGEMQEVIQRNRRRYNDYSVRGMREEERDSIDSSIGQFIQGAMAQIEGMKRSNSNNAHELGIALVLSYELKKLGDTAEDLRSQRIKQAMKTSTLRNGVKIDAAVATELAQQSAPRDDLSIETGDMVVEFAQENAALIADLVETRERVRQAERDVAEIASLNQVFSTKVLEQAKEIEVLYNTALDAVDYLDYGNNQLLAMRGKRNRMTYAVAAFLFVTSLLIILFEFIMTKRPF